MSRQMTMVASGVGPTNIFTVNVNVTPVNVGFGVTVSDGAVLQYTIEHTYHDLWKPYKIEDVEWFPFLENQSATSDGYYGYPISGFRVNITAWESGSVVVNVIQAGT